MFQSGDKLGGASTTNLKTYTFIAFTGKNNMNVVDDESGKVMFDQPAHYYKKLDKDSLEIVELLRSDKGLGKVEDSLMRNSIPYNIRVVETNASGVHIWGVMVRKIDFSNARKILRL